MLILELKLWVLNEPFRQCNIRTHQVCPLLEQISDVVLWSSCMCKYKYIYDRIVLVLVTFYQLNLGVTLYIFYKWLFMSQVMMCVTLWVLSPPCPPPAASPPWLLVLCLESSCFLTLSPPGDSREDLAKLFLYSYMQFCQFFLRLGHKNLRYLLKSWHNK